MRKFKTIFLDEAIEILDSLKEQARDKIIYNILKVEGGVINNDLFKNWKVRTFGSSEPCTMASNIGCLPFGTPRKTLW